jgi:hypothetical protein
MELAYDGNVGDPAMEWLDWADGQYEVDDVECIDPLFKMVKEYKATT